MKKAILLAVVTIAVLCFACGSLLDAQLPPSEAPLNLVDVGSGTVVDSVLIIPMHTTSIGIATGGGHGPGRMSYEESLVTPFVYRRGEAFKLRRPRSFGFLFGPGVLFIGRGMTIKGVVAVSRSHRALFVWALWDRSLGEPFELKPANEPLAYRKRFLALLDGGVIRGSDLTREEQDSFSLIPSRQIEVKLTTEERTMVRDYLAPGS